MSQTFHVLVCVDCKTFQVHIVKKSSNKWNCKICNAKQTVLQVYAKGTGAECREVVQKLNQARGQLEETQKLKELSVAQAKQEAAACEDADQQFFVESEKSNTRNYTQGPVQASTSQLHKSGIFSVPPEQSKWRIFLEDS